MIFRTLLLILVVCLTFSIGVIVTEFKYFPYNYIQQAYHQFVKKESNLPTKFSIPLETLKAKHQQVSINFQTIRKNLTSKVILPESVVSTDIIKNDELNHTILSKLYGLTVESRLHFSEKQKSKRLLIYIQGHAGSPDSKAYFHELKQYALSNSIDVLAMSMLGKGYNYDNGWFPSTVSPSGKVNLDSTVANRHDIYSLFKDTNFPEVDGLALFLSPHYWQIKKISENYDEIFIVGLSGGGWYTVWLNSLIAEIDLAISVAGSVPLVYNIMSDNVGDYEQNYSRIYQTIDYFDLYFLGISASNNKKKLELVYNSKDPCCFKLSSSKHLKTVLDEIGAAELSVDIIKNVKHSIIAEDIINRVKRYIE